MTTRFPHLRAAIMRQPWAIIPESLEAIAELVERRAEGIFRVPAQFARFEGNVGPNGALHLVCAESLTPAAARASGDGSMPQNSLIAVINVMGVIAQHAAQVDDICGPGGTSTERVTNSLRAALNDPSVKAIVFNIDSPGGNVYGVQALADEIMKSRGSKPMIAQANSLAASAAYWIACAADEIVITPGGEVGSVGVYALHQDVSKAAEMQGVKFTFVSAGEYKVEGNSFEPLGDEAKAAVQKMVDSYYSDFTKGVAKGRGKPVADVRDGFGKGRVLKDGDAVAAGMADRVGTLDDTLRRLSNPKKPAGASAEITAPVPVAELPDAESAPRAEQTAEDRDAFRRRRHAHRMRSA